MAKERVIKQLTEEQWERIKNTPGVVIRERKGPPKDPFFVPKIRVKEPITARELIGWDDDYEDEDEDLTRE